MSIHDGFLELAAAAIDFDLDEYERAELDRHVAGCDACRHTTAALRDDAVAIAEGTGARLPAARSAAILARALRSPPTRPIPRLVTGAAVLAILGVGLVAVGMELGRRAQEQPVAAVANQAGSGGPGGSSVAGGSPSPTAATSPQPGGSSRPGGSSIAAELPIRGSGEELGTSIRMAPSFDGDLYVSIPGPSGTVVTRLDESGRARDGWPILLPGASPCQLLLPVRDGSVRLICETSRPTAIGTPPAKGFAIDAAGRPLAGWPVDLSCCVTGRVIGDELTVFAKRYFETLVKDGAPIGEAWMMTVAADGTTRDGSRVPFVTDWPLETWALGPNGVAYGTIGGLANPSAAASSSLAAMGPAGIPKGFPVSIDGLASRPAFDAAGLIHLTVAMTTVAAPFNGPARMLVFDAAGRMVDDSGALKIAATGDCVGIEGVCDIPAAPLVGPDATTYVIDIGDRTDVVAMSPSGKVLAGWPYRSDAGLQVTGSCPAGGVCEAFDWAAPTLGPANILYLLHAAATESRGGKVIAVGPNGRVVPGWPVSLVRTGAEFWSIVAGPDGTVYALVVEPEPNGSHSATILSFDPDSTVIYKRTIIEP